ncbi:MBL fold metallo-hydrolase [Streptomyces sp. N2-109]|uniref:MBL fold metallo-hydrolase n=1 Tax=Streptomyces gossypii TaxID=2883101 RepID=A0ABT2JSY9_9ACTN|nr:MBL fold metallo-hydrolase [Streptomyces gossypii]MCT2590823.1 MBL fold metallo-hydrolase [Streptomyces gossypii]
MECLVTSGTFELDGGSWAVDNNVWLVGDDHEAVVIDPAHDVQAITTALGGRTLRAILCTHAHNDHINAAPALSAATGAPVHLHPADEVLWKLTHPAFPPGRHLSDGAELTVAGVRLRVIHTPGHAPGAVCLYVAELGTVFTGDTLFNGGPGATGRSYSDFDTLITSIRDRLLTLPGRTAVLPGHGASTLIEAEAKTLDELFAGPR